ncbi:MAG TPA: ferrous iron transport protein B [Planctomycetaceae bacterium]|nr:ferrous iron transport protein B [Planctomycetaceae bacterium]
MLITPTRPLTVACIGNPNTGKSTLFSALTGMHALTGNFPGVTVEKKIGTLEFQGRPLRLIDLPGTYSLSPRTLDEMVSVDVLLGRQPEVGTIDAVVCIADASNLERHLYVVSQVLDLGLPTVLVLNMWDVARDRGIQIDVAALSRRLGIPVVTCEAHRRQNLEAVKAAIVQVAALPVRPPLQLFPTEFYAELDQLQRDFGAGNGQTTPRYVTERLLLDPGGQVETQFTARYAERLTTALTAARDRLKAAGCKIPSVEAKVRYAWARRTLSGVMTVPTDRVTTTSDRIDRFLTHRVTGVVVFCVVMFAVFQAIYLGAEPLMTAIEAGQGWIGGQLSAWLPPGPVQSLVVDGVVAGVGGVLVFLPQIVLLFLFIALLEDCGYMARAAFLMDKLMVKVGLSGKSFVPLMSSFACAVPGIMATRVIENRRDRMTTILVAPLMSCSARLPVYVLMVEAFLPDVRLFGWLPLHGTVLFVMTFFGAIVAIPVAWLLKSTLFRGETPPFVMELPTYKWPSPRIVLLRVYDRAKAFVVRAGTLIFATSVLVWAASYFPGDHTRQHELAAQVEAGDDSQATALNAESERLLEQSYLGRLGKAIEPAIQPLGWDWKIGVGVIASFPAREVIISTLGTIYSLGGDVDEADTGLREAMQQSTWPDGRPVYTIPVAVSIMVFFALCAQCASTLMVIHRETNHWGWAAFTFAYMTGLAYLGAWAAYQIGSAL